MELYAIRHKKTGKLMPSKMTRTSARGWSHWVPDEPTPDGYSGSGGLGGVARFFATRHAANCAVTAWLSGVSQASRGRDPFDGEYYEELTVSEPPTPRHKGDLEVVAFALTEVPETT